LLCASIGIGQHIAIVAILCVRYRLGMAFTIITFFLKKMGLHNVTLFEFFMIQYTDIQLFIKISCYKCTNLSIHICVF